MTFHVPNQYRVRTGIAATTDADTGFGCFFIPHGLGRERVVLRCIVHDGITKVPAGHELGGWEHVSVSLPNRCPTWAQMDYCKRLFWDDEDAVMQLHAPRSQWVNNHAYCLHLWRPVAGAIPLPPALLVGRQELGELVR